MRRTALPTSELLDEPEKFYGQQEACWPEDPYEFIVWWHCGYPASNLICARGWEKESCVVGYAEHEVQIVHQTCFPLPQTLFGDLRAPRPMT